MGLFNIKIHKKHTKLRYITPLIGQECMANIIGNRMICILKSITIDSNIWAHVYNPEKTQEFTVSIEDVWFEAKEK